MTKEELEAFEKWAASEGRSIKRSNPDYAPQLYASAATNNARAGWIAGQAALASDTTLTTISAADSAEITRAMSAHQPEVQPVLWIDSTNLKAAQEYEKGALRYVMPKPERLDDVPLYTHPAPPSVLVKAASDALEWMGKELSSYPEYRDCPTRSREIYETLFAALKNQNDTPPR